MDCRSKWFGFTGSITEDSVRCSSTQLLIKKLFICSKIIQLLTHTQLFALTNYKWCVISENDDKVMNATLTDLSSYL